MGPDDIISLVCPKHKLEVIGTACDEIYCIECSKEDQEALKLPGPKVNLPALDFAHDGHGKWVIKEKVK